MFRKFLNFDTMNEIKLHSLVLKHVKLH